MGETVGQILGNGIGVAISPLPIVAIILVLFSPTASRNGPAFLVGWVVGLGAVGTLLLVLAPAPRDGEPSTASSVLHIVVGVLFLLLGFHNWKTRPQLDVEPALPSWMSAIADSSPLKALGFGFVLTVANPKNLGLAAAAGATISSSGLAMGDQVVVLVVFVILASVTIAIPVIAVLVAPERTRPVLGVMKGWLTHNNNTVMMVLFVVLGAKVLGEGLRVFG